MVTINVSRRLSYGMGGGTLTTIMVKREDARLGPIATCIVQDARLETGEPYRTVKALVTAMRFMGHDVTVTGDMARDFK